MANIRGPSRLVYTEGSHLYGITQENRPEISGVSNNISVESECVKNINIRDTYDLLLLSVFLQYYLGVFWGAVAGGLR